MYLAKRVEATDDPHREATRRSESVGPDVAIRGMLGPAFFLKDAHHALAMAKERRQHDEEAWKNAKAVCRLNTRQVEMARALGMNPRKLPRLRPSPRERWKLPVGAFIEECYRKRFGEHPQNREPADSQPRTRPAISDAYGARSVQDSMSQAEELVCYLTNLADDLHQWLAHGKVTDVLPEVSKELRDVATALDTGAWISAIPKIPLPPRPARAAPTRRRAHKPSQEDGDDIPF